MAMKGMSMEAIADVLYIQAATVARWLSLAAEQCDKVNELIPKSVLFQINKSFMTVFHDQIFDCLSKIRDSKIKF
jgi:hypothetical protein